MGDGRRLRQRKNAQSESAAEEDKFDSIPDALLCLAFLRLTSPADLVRAAFVCRRWRRVIAADVLGSQAPQQHRVIGHYHVDEPKPLAFAASRPPGRHPVFVPSPSAAGAWTKDAVVLRALKLDFLPPTGFLEPGWELADVRGGLLLLARFSNADDLLGLVACDPLARRYKKILFSAWFHGDGQRFLGAFLRADDAGNNHISLSDFGVTCVLCRDSVARAYVFSSSAAAGAGEWTRCPGRAGMRRDISFAGSTAGCAYWTVGDRRVVALDKEEGQPYFWSTSVLPDALLSKRPSLDYAYQLTIQAAVTFDA